MTEVGFITGYPRSRTAWLAELLYQPPLSFAFHEGTNGMATTEQWKARLFDRPEPHVIDCNPALLHYAHWAMDEFKHSRIVLISRYEPTAKEASWIFAQSQIGRADFEMAWQSLQHGFDELATRPGVMQIAYTALDDWITCRELTKFLVPGFQFDKGRFEELRRKKIEQDLQFFVGSNQ